MYATVFRTSSGSDKQFHVSCFNTLADTTTNILQFAESGANLNPSTTMINYQGTIWSFGNKVFPDNSKYSILNLNYTILNIKIIILYRYYLLHICKFQTLK